MHIEADRALILAQTPTVRHLTVRITAPPRKDPAVPRPPVAVSLVLDRSGSMDGRKIEVARTATAHAIRLLNELDQLAVVVYDQHVDTLLDATPASNEAKNNVLARLAQVEARGSTDLAGGWFRGAEELGARGAAKDAPLRGPGEREGAAPQDQGPQEGAPVLEVRRVLLLTDGLANHGIVDHEQLRQAAAKFRDQGISTSTFGVGADFDEELLSSIATRGGGHFYFIEKAGQIPDLLASELGETLEVVARDAVFDVTCGPGVEAMLLNDLPVESSSGRVRVRLGDLVADQEITLALAISCAPRPGGSLAFLDCRVTDRDSALFSEPMRIEWRAADSAENQQQPVNVRVLVVVAEAMADRARALALAANRRGQFDEARRILHEVSDHVRTLARGNEQIETIIERLTREEEQFVAPMSAIARKAKYFEGYVAAQSRQPEGRAKRKRE